LLRTLRTLTVITRTIHTSLFHDCWARFAHLRLLLVQYTQACCTILEIPSHTYGYYSYNTHKPVPRLLSTLRTLPVISRTIHTSLFHDCWARFAHLRLLLVQYTQACSTIVEQVSHTYGYYSYNTHKPVVQLSRTLRTLTVITRTITHKPVPRLLSTLRTLTVITRTIHTSLLSNCWERFAHLRLLLVQYTQACSTIAKHASHTYGYYSYNTHKPVPRLLSTLRTLAVITRTIHTSLFHDYLARFAHLRLLLVQYTQACCTIVENASHTYGYYSYTTDKPVVQLLRTLRTLTVITRTIHRSLFHDCLPCKQRFLGRPME